MLSWLKKRSDIKCGARRTCSRKQGWQGFNISPFSTGLYCIYLARRAPKKLVQKKAGRQSFLLKSCHKPTSQQSQQRYTSINDQDYAYEFGLLLWRSRIQVPARCPMRHWNGVPSHILGKDCLINIPAFRLGRLGTSSIPSVGMEWNGDASHSMKKSGQPHPTGFKTLHETYLIDVGILKVIRTHILHRAPFGW